MPSHARKWSELTPEDVARHNAAKGARSPVESGQAAPSPTKYKSRSCLFQGQRFDSKRELRTWIELQQRQAAGEIDQLRRQVSYPLHAYCSRSDGVVGEEVGVLRVDFVYRDRREGIEHVVDAKGYRTVMFIWKARHFRLEYGIDIELV